MSEVNFIDMIKSCSGKVSSNSSFWFYRRNDKTFTGHSNHPRDYSINPVTEEEQKTRVRLALMAPAYRALRNSPDEWSAFLKEFNEKRNTGGHYSKMNSYTYFVSRGMEKLKSDGPLAADPSQYLQDWSLKPHS